jgi:type IV fimbrial biogenesis protein FimT
LTGAGAGAGWAGGWFIFGDLSTAALYQFDAMGFPVVDIALRYQDPIPGVGQIVDSGGTVFPIVFGPTGRLVSPLAPFRVRFGDASFGAPQQRVVCIALSGRASIAGDGSATCGLAS